MTMKFLYNVGDMIARASADSTIVINNAAKKLLEEDKNLSPTDTTEYINAWKIIPAAKIGNRVVAYVENDSEHAQIIETGIQGRVFDYHRGPRSSPFRPVIFTGIGARVAQRAIDNLGKTIFKL